jgi:hypothetical protein
MSRIAVTSRYERELNKVTNINKLNSGETFRFWNGFTDSVYIKVEPNDNVEEVYGFEDEFYCSLNSGEFFFSRPESEVVRVQATLVTDVV